MTDSAHILRQHVARTLNWPMQWGSTPMEVEASFLARIAVLEAVTLGRAIDLRWKAAVSAERAKQTGSEGAWFGGSTDAPHPAPSRADDIVRVRSGMTAVVDRVSSLFPVDPSTNAPAPSIARQVLGSLFEDAGWFVGAAEWERALYGALVGWVVADGRPASASVVDAYVTEVRRGGRRPEEPGRIPRRFTHERTILSDAAIETGVASVITGIRATLRNLQIDRSPV